MSITQPVAAEGGGGFHAPGPASFELPPIFGDVTKPMVLLTLSALLVFGFFYAASRNASLVPGRLQFAGEMVYGFVRNNMARDNIGTEHYMKFVPYLFTLFTFILVNNYYGVIPFLQFPSFSRIGFIGALRPRHTARLRGRTAKSLSSRSRPPRPPRHLRLAQRHRHRHRLRPDLRAHLFETARVRPLPDLRRRPRRTLPHDQLHPRALPRLPEGGAEDPA